MRNLPLKSKGCQLFMSLYRISEVSSIGLWLFWYFLLVFLLKFLYRNERILEEQARHDISLATMNLRVL